MTIRRIRVSLFLQNGRVLDTSSGSRPTDRNRTDSESSSDEHFRRLEALEKCEAETLHMLQQVQERFRRHRQLIEDMRNHLIDQEGKKQRKLRRQLKQLRQSVGHDRGPSAAAAAAAAAISATQAGSAASQSPQPAANQARQPTSESSGHPALRDGYRR